MKTKSKVESPNAVLLLQSLLPVLWERVSTSPEATDQYEEACQIVSLAKKPTPPQPVQAGTHTPLPWKARKYRNSDGDIWIDCDAYKGDRALGGTLATAHLKGTGNGTVEANAEFICRAVNSHAELLDACKSVVAFIESCKLSGLKPNPDYSQFATELYTLRAAIARAEGGAS